MTPSNPGFSGSQEPVAVAAVPRGSSKESIISAVRQVAEKTTDFSWLSRGDMVFIKVVSNSPNPYPATTSPLAVVGMVEMLIKKGAGRVIVGDKPGVQSVYQDRDRQKGSSRDVFLRNGLQRAALESGAEVHYFEEAGFDAYFEQHTLHSGHWQGALFFPNILKQADHIVLLPRVSRHTLAGVTLGLKAAVGWLRDDSRLELHRDAAHFYEKTAEINDVPVLRDKLRLVLSVGTQVQTNFGPDAGFAAEPDPGLIFGSTSILAHDMISLRWLLYNREHHTPSSRLAWYRDPYVTLPGMMNRIFVGTIWGLGPFFQAGSYRPVSIRSVRTEPVMSRAAQLWGGFPELDIMEANGGVPETILRYMRETAPK
ncbi:MAG: DUF362 domain-containing protein [Deltaproteobacteria bacterium]|nr:DUF362 domain-containing protein [Deltaproteobacteria bacterium]